VGAYEDVHAAWQRLSRDGHIGMSDAIQIVAAAGNTDDGRRALAEILTVEDKVTRIDPDAHSYLRISRDIPLPPGVEDQRADGFFRTRLYSGTRLSKTHRVINPNEFLYFNFSIVMLSGTLDDVAAVRKHTTGSGYDPVIVRTGGGEKAIGTVMVNDFRDTTFAPYREVIFMVTAVPETSSETCKLVDYVNAFSLQVPLDRGATVYVLKLWLDELSPIDGGNDFLGSNKELGCFSFEDASDGTRRFRAWDKDLKLLVSGAVPRTTVSVEAVRAVETAYRAAAARAGTAIPTSTLATIPVASRPDGYVGPATKWAFAVDWRQTVVQEVTASQIGLTFGESEWGRRFEGFGFRPALSFYSPSGVGQILQHIGDAAYNSA
jgi:hypothetical protein